MPTHVIGSFLRTAESPQDYAPFTAQVLELAGCSTELLRDGIYELPSLQVGRIQLAVDQQACFFAARWTSDSSVSTHVESVTCDYEVFMVAPASRPVQIGLRVLGATGELSEPPSWWVSLAPSAAPPAPAPVPAFIVLVGTLNGLSYETPAQVQEAQAARLLQQDAEIDYLNQLLREQRESYRHLKGALIASRASVQALSAAAPPLGDDEVALEAFDDLVDWCSAHAETITVLPRALHGAKKSQYEDPAVLTACLTLLEGPYRAYRKGELTREELLACLQEHGLRLSGSVSLSIAGGYGEHYFVKWREKRWFLDSHLAKGGGRDPRYCLRVYFFWDAELQKVVVGSMPTHLDNSLT